MTQMKYAMTGGLLAVLLMIASAASGAQQPVVLELFTSHGCSSCPPADALLRRLYRKPPMRNIQVIALSEHVDYWDNLGWPDRFSKAQFTARQRTYAGQKFGGSVYTPALVINGRREVVGSHTREVKSAVRAAASQASLPVSIAVQRADASHIKATVTLPNGAPRKSSQIWLALTQNHAVSHIGGGENNGRTLREDGVVRTLESIGDIAGGGRPSGIGYSGVLNLPKNVNRANLSVAAFVQNQSSLAIVGAASRPLR